MDANTGVRTIARHRVRGPIPRSRVTWKLPGLACAGPELVDGEKHEAFAQTPYLWEQSPNASKETISSFENPDELERVVGDAFVESW